MSAVEALEGLLPGLAALAGSLERKAQAVQRNPNPASTKEAKQGEALRLLHQSIGVTKARDLVEAALAEHRAVNAGL